MRGHIYCRLCIWPAARPTESAIAGALDACDHWLNDVVGTLSDTTSIRTLRPAMTHTRTTYAPSPACLPAARARPTYGRCSKCRSCGFLEYERRSCGYDGQDRSCRTNGVAVFFIILAAVVVLNVPVLLWARRNGKLCFSKPAPVVYVNTKNPLGAAAACPVCSQPVTHGAPCGRCGSPFDNLVPSGACSKCTKPLRPGAKFCGSCGLAIPGAAAPAAAMPAAAIPVGVAVPAPVAAAAGAAAATAPAARVAARPAGRRDSLRTAATS